MLIQREEILRNLDFKFLFAADPENFNYTNQGENALIDGVDDAEEFLNTKEAMSLLGMYHKSSENWDV